PPPVNAPRPPPPAPLLPITSLTRTPSILRVLPVAVSPTHSSIPAAVVLVKAKCAPSGLHRPALSLAPGGRSIFISVPSGTLRRVSALLKVVLWRPLVFGLMRWPASRSIGWESSAIGG